MVPNVDLACQKDDLDFAGDVNKEWPMIEPKIMAFIIGSGRCGTTWVGKWLKQHPDCFVAQETYYFASLKEYSRNTYLELYAYGGYKSELCLVDQTHRHVLYKKLIKKHFPQSKFIHLVRDGKNVVYSLRNAPWRIHWKKIPEIESDIEHWIKTSLIAMDHDPAALVMKYEDLVSHPEMSRQITSFLGLSHHLDITPWEDPVNTKHTEHRMDWWKGFEAGDKEKLRVMNEVLKNWDYEEITGAQKIKAEPDED